jgi:hypothetical protein
MAYALSAVMIFGQAQAVVRNVAHPLARPLFFSSRLLLPRLARQNLLHIGGFDFEDGAHQLIGSEGVGADWVAASAWVLLGGLAARHGAPL